MGGIGLHLNRFKHWSNHRQLLISSLWPPIGCVLPRRDTWLDSEWTLVDRWVSVSACLCLTWCTTFSQPPNLCIKSFGRCDCDVKRGITAKRLRRYSDGLITRALWWDIIRGLKLVFVVSSRLFDGVLVHLVSDYMDIRYNVSFSPRASHTNKHVFVLQCQTE